MSMLMEDPILSDPFMMAFIVIYGIFMLIALACSVAMYIFQSMGLYTIAKRRGIHHPGLAWVPVANMWILGSISDQYQYVVKRKIRNRRKVLLGLLIATYVLVTIAAVGMIVGITSGVFDTMDTAPAPAIFGTVAIVLIYLVGWVLAVVAMVFMYIAYYDLFASCNPSNAVLFLVLSIFFNFLLPVFVFICRKKDEGMPPRRIQVPVAPWTPAPPSPTPTWQSAASAEPVVEAPVVEPVAEEPETEE